MGSNQVEIEFLAKEEVTKILNKIEENTRKTTKTMQTESKKTTSSFNNIKNAVNSLSLVTTLGMGAAGLAVVNFGKESVDAFLKAERVSTQFSLMFGKNSDSLIQDLKRIGEGTVSTTNLMQASIRATQLGISQADIAGLFEVARAKAKLMGIDSTQAFNDITLGIGRQSKMILDNLGIVLNLEKAYKKYADTNNLVVESLTEFEKKQAIAKAIMLESQGVLLLHAATMDDHLESVERLKIGWEEFKVGAGDAIVSTYDDLKGLTVAIGITDNNLVKLAQQTVPENVSEFEKLRKEIEITSAKIQLIGTSDQRAKLEEYKQTIGNLSSEIQNFQQSLDGVRISLLNIGSIPTLKELTISEDLQKAKVEVDKLTLANFNLMESGIGMNEEYRKNAKLIEEINNGAMKRAELELQIEQGLRTQESISAKVAEAQSFGTTTPFDVAEIEAKRLALQQQLIDLPISIDESKKKLEESAETFANIGQTISAEKVEVGALLMNIELLATGMNKLLGFQGVGMVGNVFEIISKSVTDYRLNLEKNQPLESTSIDLRISKMKELNEVVQSISNASLNFTSNITGNMGIEVE